MTLLRCGAWKYKRIHEQVFDGRQEYDLLSVHDQVLATAVATVIRVSVRVHVPFTTTGVHELWS